MPVNKRGSVAIMMEFMGLSTPQEPEQKRKKSLSHWAQFRTVSNWYDAQKDFDEHQTKTHESAIMAFWHEADSWLIPAFVGVLTATSGALIEYMVEWYASMRFGVCLKPCKYNKYCYATEETCDKEDWYSWDKTELFGDQTAYVFFIIVCTLIAGTSALLTWAFAPFSRGSGIPEIKTVLGGFTFPEVLAGNTLVIKIIGLAMSVGAGLSCGKEGPLVHIACCWSSFVTKFIPRFRTNEKKQRECMSAACAAGVAVAFGAPLGGVLFSLEEASSIFPMRTMLRAFFAASVAAVTLQYWDPTGTGKLTMFNAEYNNPPSGWEYPVFMLLGIVGGCVGALFVHMNIKVAKGRAEGTPWRKRVHVVLEVALISFFTAVTSYYVPMTQVLSNVTIRAMFHDCADPQFQAKPELLDSFMLGLCKPNGDGTNGPNITGNIVLWSLLAGALRYFQMTFTFGCGCASGLFIPSLLVGSVIGRCTGIGMWHLNEWIEQAFGHRFIKQVYPGMYGMLGAAGTLGGVCRVTISLVVIMFELTGGLQLVVPFMIVCMVAKWVGDSFNLGIYDYMIIVRKYPFLHEPDEVTYHHNANDLMDEMIDTLHPQCGIVADVKTFLSETKHGGFPILQSSTDNTLLGFAHTAPLLNELETRLERGEVSDFTKVEFTKCLPASEQALRSQQDSRSILDVSKFCDTTTFSMVSPDTPAAQIQQVFRNLGIKTCLVVKKGMLVGMITKKSFITHMEELHHTAHVPKTQHYGHTRANEVPLLPH